MKVSLLSLSLNYKFSYAGGVGDDLGWYESLRKLLAVLDLPVGAGQEEDGGVVVCDGMVPGWPTVPHEGVYLDASLMVLLVNIC